MIIFDTETTGFIGPTVLPLEQQPHIIEFAGIAIDSDTLEIKNILNFHVNPGVPLSPEAKKVTGLTDEFLHSQKKFASFYPALVEFFYAEKTLVAHNAAYDVGILAMELGRIERLYRFPWPSKHICTVELTFDMQGHRLSLENLYYKLFDGVDLPSNGKLHTATYDTEILYQCVKKLRELGRI